MQVRSGNRSRERPGSGYRCAVWKGRCVGVLGTTCRSPDHRAESAEGKVMGQSPEKANSRSQSPVPAELGLWLVVMAPEKTKAPSLEHARPGMGAGQPRPGGFTQVCSPGWPGGLVTGRPLCLGTWPVSKPEPSSACLAATALRSASAPPAPGGEVCHLSGAALCLQHLGPVSGFAGHMCPCLCFITAITNAQGHSGFSSARMLPHSPVGPA